MYDAAENEQDVGRWLALLRDGNDADRLLARTELGLILEARGLLDAAAEAYERNVEAGVTDRRPYDRLAALARARGDRQTEARVLRALADVLAPPLIPPPPLLSRQAEEGEQNAGRLGTSVAPMDAWKPAPTTPPVGAGFQHPVPSDPDPNLPAPQHPIPATDPPNLPASQHSLSATASSDLPVHPERTDEMPVADSRPAGRSRLLLVLAAVLLPVLVVVAGALLVPAEDRPALVRPSIPTASPSPVPVAPSPAVDLRLAADAPIPSPSATTLATPSPLPSPTLTPTPLPARCADASLRFPETRDTEGAVRAAYRDHLTRQGVGGDPAGTMFAGLAEAYATRHAEVVAGWMAVILQRERRSLPLFSLADYVASDVITTVGPNEYQLRATTSPQGWAEMRAWPADSCEGAFMRNPANVRWVDLMQASVGDITWALPTPQPPR